MNIQMLITVKKMSMVKLRPVSVPAVSVRRPHVVVLILNCLHRLFVSYVHQTKKVNIKEIDIYIYEKAEKKRAAHKKK